MVSNLLRIKGCNVLLSAGTALGMPLLRVEGDIDSDDTSALEQAMWDAFGRSGKRLVLDLAECTHIGSSGLAVLFSLIRWASHQGGLIIAVSPSPVVSRLLSVVRLVDEQGFRVVGDLESAQDLVASMNTGG